MAGDKLRRHYKKVSSGFKDWEQKLHAEEYMIFPENIGENLSIDEVSLSKGELYTFLTNKAGKGKRGTIVACIRGTTSKEIVNVLMKIVLESRLKVKVVSLDMAKNMESAVKEMFPNAELVTDRFHVVQLVCRDLQQIRIEIKKQVATKENEAIKLAKSKKEKYVPIEFSNGDTPKQLLTRSRYILAKKQTDWTINQAERGAILFAQYPLIEKAYKQTMVFRNIYTNNTKIRAKEQFLNWIEAVNKDDGFLEFQTSANTVENHLETILNFFNNGTTNANAESFNARIKLFRANLRGVTDTSFFLFRMSKLYA